MTRRRRAGRRKRPAGKSSRTRAVLWLVLGILAVGVLLVGGHLFRSLPRGHDRGSVSREGGVRERLEAVLGHLDPAGVQMGVEDSRQALKLTKRMADILASDPTDRVALEPWVQTSRALLGAVVIEGIRTPVRIVWATASDDGAQLAVVIDDMGRNLGLEREFLDLPFPITPSLLPYLGHTQSIADLARSRGREFLLHLPLQPQGYPAQNPGEGAILVGMKEAEVRERVRALLRAVPGASGVNNHMGSRLTELGEPMAWVLEEVRAEGLFFLDSVTTGHTVGWELARTLNMGWARRDIFLDNVQTVEAVGAQLDKAIRLAKEQGYAVAIGHPHRTTLDALTAWAPKFKAAGVQVVPLRRLIHHGDGA